MDGRWVACGSLRRDDARRRSPARLHLRPLPSAPPPPTPPTPSARVSWGSFRSLEGGEAYTCGVNDWVRCGVGVGTTTVRLGDGSTTDQDVPVEVNGPGGVGSFTGADLSRRRAETHLRRPHRRHRVVLGRQRQRPTRRQHHRRLHHTPSRSSGPRGVGTLRGVTEVTAGDRTPARSAPTAPCGAGVDNGKGQLGNPIGAPIASPPSRSPAPAAPAPSAPSPASPPAPNTPARSAPTAPCGAGATTAKANSATTPPPNASHPSRSSAPRRRHPLRRHHPHRRREPHLRGPHRHHRVVLGRQQQRPTRRQHQEQPFRPHPSSGPEAGLPRQRRRLAAGLTTPALAPPTAPPGAGATTAKANSATTPPPIDSPRSRSSARTVRHPRSVDLLGAGDTHTCAAPPTAPPGAGATTAKDNSATAPPPTPPHRSERSGCDPAP